MTKIGRSASASGATSEAITPVREKSSGPITSSTVQPRSTLWPSGSSWVRVPGTAGGPSLLLVGHIDEISVVVTNLGDDGLAAVRTTSGWDPAVAVGQRVDVQTRGGAVPGVVAGKRHKRKRGQDRKPVESDDLFLDVGAKDGDELRKLIRPGDRVIWHGGPLVLNGNRGASRAFDNRMGCYLALGSARRIDGCGGAPG